MTASTMLPSKAWRGWVVGLALSVIGFSPALTKAFDMDVLFRQPADLSINESGEASRMSNAQVIDRIDLKNAIRAAMEHSSEVKAAQARLDSVNAQYGKSVSPLLPNVTSRYSGGKERSSPASIADPTNPSVAKAVDDHIRRDRSLAISQALFDAPNYLEMQRRHKLLQNQEINVRVVQEDLVLQVVQAYLALAQSRLTFQAAEDQEAELDRLLQYVEKRAKAGAISVSEADRVRGRVLSLRSTKLELQGTYFTALKEFTRLTGVAPKWLAIPDGILAMPGIPRTANAAIDYARQHSPEVQAVIYEQQAMDKEGQSILSRVLPKVSFEFSDTRSTNAGGNPITQKDRRSLFVLSWSMFSGGGDYFEYQSTAARRRESSFRLVDFREKLEQSISSSYRLWNLNDERLELAMQEYKTTGKVVGSFRDQFDKAARPLLDLLEALDRDYQARINYLRLQVTDISYRYQVVRQLGLGMRLTGLDPNAAINFPVFFPELIGQAGLPPGRAPSLDMPLNNSEENKDNKVSGQEGAGIFLGNALKEENAAAKAPGTQAESPKSAPVANLSAKIPVAAPMPAAVQPAVQPAVDKSPAFRNDAVPSWLVTDKPMVAPQPAINQPAAAIAPANVPAPVAATPPVVAPAVQENTPSLQPAAVPAAANKPKLLYPAYPGWLPKENSAQQPLPERLSK